jgi:hypothetical protein
MFATRCDVENLSAVRLQGIWIQRRIPHGPPESRSVVYFGNPKPLKEAL